MGVHGKRGSDPPNSTLQGTGLLMTSGTRWALRKERTGVKALLCHGDLKNDTSFGEKENIGRCNYCLKLFKAKQLNGKGTNVCLCVRL